MYETDEGLKAGQELFANDNQLPLSITALQQKPIIHTYEEYKTSMSTSPRHLPFISSAPQKCT